MKHIQEQHLCSNRVNKSSSLSMNTNYFLSYCIFCKQIFDLILIILFNINLKIFRYHWKFDKLIKLIN